VQKWLVPWLVQKVEWVNRSEEERVLALGLCSSSSLVFDF